MLSLTSNKAHVASDAGMHTELATIERETDRLVQAIFDGASGSKVRDRMIKLEDRKVQAEAKLRNADTRPGLTQPYIADG